MSLFFRFFIGLLSAVLLSFASVAMAVEPATETRDVRSLPATTPTTLPTGTVAEPVGFTVKLDMAYQEQNDKFCWFHPRAAAIPGAGRDGKPAVIMTLQKHLKVSDYYSGLYVMRNDDLGKTWTGPEQRPELDWVHGSGGVVTAPADVTPGWHAPSGKLLVIGCCVRYNEQGRQIHDQPRSSQTVYAAFDPVANNWSAWKILRLPPDDKFELARSACAQWLVEDDDTLLLPIYFRGPGGGPFSATVLRCAFDGKELKYLGHGDELSLNIARGLCEPSIVRFQGRYFLTLRNDVRGYVTVGDDGLHYAPIRPWTFDDGSELGSYNTQQHWLTHSEGLLLVYTRRGANNDHIMRHRAPLFVAQVDPKRLCVLRETEHVAVPERGAPLGNFGACRINERESWITVGESMFGIRGRSRGADGSLFVARIIWSRPNGL